MWDLPGPGIEPVSPALAGGFLTTAPPGKPLISALKFMKLDVLVHAGHTLKARVSSMGVLPVQSTGLCAWNGQALNLILCCHHLEILRTL